MTPERTNEPSQDAHETARHPNTSDQRVTLSVMEIAEMAARLRSYLSRNEWGDPVEHAICDQAADLLTRLSAERDRLEKEAEALRAAVSVGLDCRPTTEATAAIERAEAERDALKARVAEVLEPFANFALGWVDEHGWASKPGRIVDWFGPTDFRRASELHATLSGERT